MLRLVKFTSGWYGLEIRDIENDMDNIEVFIEGGTPVLFCNDIETAADALSIDKDDIRIVLSVDSTE